LVISKTKIIEQTESANEILAKAAKVLYNQKSVYREQRELRVRNARRRVQALQQLLERERNEVKALTGDIEEKHIELGLKTLHLKMEKDRLARLKFLIESINESSLKSKSNLAKRKEIVLVKKRRKYLLRGLMQLLPIDITSNSINRIITPREVSPSCVYVPGLGQVYGFLIIYLLKIQQFYSNEYNFKTKISFKGSKSTISDGKRKRALYLKNSSRKSVRRFQKAIDLFDQHLIQLALQVGVPRACLKRFILIGNLWNVLTFIHEHKKPDICENCVLGEVSK